MLFGNYNIVAVMLMSVWQPLSIALLAQVFKLTKQSVTIQNPENAIKRIP
jgi:hypothetical protein